MSAKLATYVWDDGTTTDGLLKQADTAPYVLIRHQSVAIDDAGVEALVGLLGEPQAATISPLAIVGAPLDGVTSYPIAPKMPPPPTLMSPSPRCVVVRSDVLKVIGLTGNRRLADAWGGFTVDVVNRGWRHVAAPGLALGPSALRRDVVEAGGWDGSTVDRSDGDANEGLTTHQLFGALRFRPLKVVIDAACFDAAPSNGTQALVMNIAEALGRARPDASIVAAVPPEQLDAARREFQPRGVEVVRRDDSIDPPDVVYRPYQLLVPSELDWLLETGDRLVVGQLDMIGFSNPSYHPSSAIFHAVRNLQRATLRAADSITFISEFGLKHALAECPDLDPDRCFVVSSGAAGPAGSAGTDSPATPRAGAPYLLCVSASFWHKNRLLAIKTFAELAMEHEYSGELILIGPEPYYGSSSAAELELVAQLRPDVAQRVRFLGTVATSTKWDLVRNADLVLYPSTVEGFGMVPFEAARVGTPCLVGQDSALSEVFGKTGAIVPSWSPVDWAAAATLILADRRVGEAIVSELERTELEHTWDGVAAKTWKSIDAAICRPRASLHAEEGGWRSRVISKPQVTRQSTAVHFGNRVVAFGQRKIRAARPG